MAERVMLIGLDSAEWGAVEHYIERGDMPNLGKLLAASTRVRMQTPVPYKAEGRWAEFLTGSTADERQYWSINDFDPANYTPLYARSAHGTYFFARPDLRTISFDVPNSVVSEDTHGIQVFGWGAHATQFPTASHPPSILHEIDERFGVHEGMLTDGHHGWHNDTYLDNLHATMVKGIRQRTEIVKWLDQRMPDWDLFTLVYGEAHVALHHYMHALDPTHPFHDHPLAERAGQRMLEIFQLLDDAIGELVDHFGADTHLVPFAMHGMTTNKADVLGQVLVPELLHRLEFREPLIDFPQWKADDPYLVLDPRVQPRHHLEALLRTPTPTTRTGLRSVPTKAIRALRHRLPAERLNDFEKYYWRRPDWWEMNIRPKTPAHKRDLYTEAAWVELESVAASSWYRTFWPQMRAFVLPSFSDCHIRLNLQGRERDGVVPAADYAAELDLVEAMLRSVVNPRTGQPIVEQVIRMRTDDPFAEIGPSADLIVSFAEVTDVIEHPEVGVVGQAPLMRFGEHSTVAWALLPNDDGARVSDEVYEPRDLPATVLDLLGKEPAPTVTGRSFSHEAAKPAR